MRRVPISRFQPMPLAVRPEPFDDADWIFELKYDGYRALAYVGSSATELVSRRGITYRQFRDLGDEMRLELNAEDAVLDGEIVRLDAEGRPQFYDLMRRRGPFTFVAFDILALNARDVRALPLLERKKLLRAIVPPGGSALLYASYVNRRGRDLFDLVCKQDLEGVVAKRKDGRYTAGPITTWVKIKNPNYSQAHDRYEWFEKKAPEPA